MSKDNNPKRRQGALKAPLEFMPLVAEAQIALVLEGGAKKYGAFNWRKEAISISTYVGAIRRHVGAIADGELVDPESGYSHWAHIAASASIALDAESIGKLVNDTVNGGGSSVLSDIHAIRKSAEAAQAVEDSKTAPPVPCCRDGMRDRLTPSCIWPTCKYVKP